MYESSPGPCRGTRRTDTNPLKNSRTDVAMGAFQCVNRRCHAGLPWNAAEHRKQTRDATGTPSSRGRASPKTRRGPPAPPPLKIFGTQAPAQSRATIAVTRAPARRLRERRLQVRVGACAWGGASAVGCRGRVPEGGVALRVCARTKHTGLRAVFLLNNRSALQVKDVPQQQNRCAAFVSRGKWVSTAAGGGVGVDA